MFISFLWEKKKKKSVYKELLVSLFSSAFPALNHSAIIKAPLEKLTTNAAICKFSKQRHGQGYEVLLSLVLNGENNPLTAHAWGSLFKLPVFVRLRTQ